MSGSVWLSAMLFLAASPLPALAGTEKLDDGLRRCAKESDQAQRLTCFDALVSTLPQIEADRFGLTSEIEHKRDPVAAQQAKTEVLTGKIAGLRQTSHGEWIFTLDNQQVWRQAEARPDIQFAVGESVHIEHGALTALYLVADKHRKVRVTRLQ